MHTLEFSINNQILTWTNTCREPVENSRGYVFARFTWDSEWDGMAKTVVFRLGANKPVMLPLDGNTVEVPPECLVRGQLAVGLIGLDTGGEVRLVTRQMLRGVPMRPSGPVSGEPPDEITLEAWEKVLGSIGDLNELTTLDKSTLVAAINEAARSGGGDGTSFTIDETLKMVNGKLGVNTTDNVAQDNTLPITSAAVAATVGNIEVILQTI